MAIDTNPEFWAKYHALRSKIGTNTDDGKTAYDYDKEREKVEKELSKPVQNLQLEGGKLVC